MIIKLFINFGIGIFIGLSITAIFILGVYYITQKRLQDMIDGMDEYEIYDMTNNRYLIKGTDLKGFYRNHNLQDYITHIGKQMERLSQYDSQTLSRLKINYPKKFEKKTGKSSGIYRGFVDENKVFHLEKIEDILV